MRRSSAAAPTQVPLRLLLRLDEADASARGRCLSRSARLTDDDATTIWLLSRKLLVLILDGEGRDRGEVSLRSIQPRLKNTTSTWTKNMSPTPSAVEPIDSLEAAGSAAVARYPPGCGLGR